MIGTYRLVYTTETETLRLLPDHSYIKMTSLGQNQVQETGTWKFKTIGNGKYISFFAQGSETVDTKPVEKWFSGFYLGLDEGGAKLYKKVE